MLLKELKRMIILLVKDFCTITQLAECPSVKRKVPGAGPGSAAIYISNLHI